MVVFLFLVNNFAKGFVEFIFIAIELDNADVIQGFNFGLSLLFGWFFKNDMFFS